MKKIKKILLMLLFMFFFSSLITVSAYGEEPYFYVGITEIYADDVILQTYNGSNVVAKYIENNMSTNDIERANNYYNNIIPDAEFLHTCTTYYNCHSYAWYNRDFSSNRYWIEDPSIFIDDNTYFEVDTPSMGDIICYYDDLDTTTVDDDEIIHSGIVLGTSGEVNNNICGNANMYRIESKWGFYPVYSHNGDDCPYVSTYGGTANYVKYYRLRITNEYVLTNNSHIEITETLEYNEFNLGWYELYKINVVNSGMYVFDLSASNSLKNNLYDNSLNEIQIANSSALTNKYNYGIELIVGTYYFRVQSTNPTNICNVNIQLEYHIHNYLYKNYSSTQHKIICSCGINRLEPHVILNSNPNICIKCKAFLNSSALAAANNVKYKSNNGSYVLENGIIVLDDKDLSLYMLGELEFFATNIDK